MSLPQAWRALEGHPGLAAAQAFAARARAEGKSVHPPEDRVFRALELTAPEQTRVLILGQDPYHGPGQAEGMSFSVPPGIRIPPSLRNIFKEIHRDIGIAPPAQGHLESWARQGVLLLNSVLTVESGQAGSHARRGWEDFTDAVVRLVSASDHPVAFLLWGAYAQRKAGFVESPRHIVLRTAHPSPLSAHRGFLGCGHFSAANAFLASQGETPIDWRLSDPS